MACLITGAGCYLALTVGMMAPDYTENSDEIEATNKVQPTTSLTWGNVSSSQTLRYELELSWHRDTLHGYNPSKQPGDAGEQSAEGNVNTFALLANLRWQPNWRYAPYVMGGLGPAYQERDGQSLVTNTDLSRSGVYLAWQLGVGVSSRVTEDLELDAGMRYFETEDQSQYGGVLEMRYSLP